MKISFVFFLAVVFCSFTENAASQNARVSINARNISVSELLTLIENQTDYLFVYNKNNVDVTRKVTLQVKEEPVVSVLGSVFKDTDIHYVMEGLHIVLVNKNRPGGQAELSVPAQGVIVTGTVSDESGSPVPGVNIVIKGTATGVVTDVNGKYSVTVPDRESVLIFSFVGYISQELPVGSQTTVNVVMKEDTQEIEEVIVVGYGTSRKRDIVSAVASIKGKTFSAASTTNVKDVLQGKVAGVDVQAARFPGDDQGILIRGARSLNAGNNPLIIIDGVPGSLSSVSTYDIESVEVLKDAASSAIYGSMGANGVILVTTKRAKKGAKTEVNFNTYLGVSVPHMIPLQSGEEYVQFRRDGYRYAHGWDNPFKDEDVFTASELDIIKSGEYTDWQDLLYRNSFLQSYHLSVGNSGEKTRLYLSFKYDKEDGYYKNNDMENMNLTLTADHDLTKFWTIGSTVRLRRNNSADFRLSGNKVTTDDVDKNNIQNNTEILYMTPLSRPYNDDGTLNYFPNPLNTSGYNPLSDYIPGQYANDRQTNIVNLNLTSNITITKWLSMHTNFGYIFTDFKRGYFYGKNAYINKGVKTSSGKEYSNSGQYTLNHIITFNHTFGEQHHLIADVIGEIQRYRSDNSILSGDNQPVEYTSYHDLDSNTKNVKIGSGYSDWSLASGLVRIRYNFGSKYFLNAAIRADGSSRLAKGNQWAFFPSAGLGWSIKDEQFLADTDWVNNLKLRFSYGTVGNTAIDPYKTQAELSQKSYLFGENSNDKFFVYSPSSIVNLDLGWEISRTINGGIDFGFLNNKFSGYFELYQTRTSDLLMKRSIPTFTGFDMIWQNVGKTENKGLEVNLNYSPVRTKDMTIDIFFNASRNWEKIIELISGEDLPNNRWFIGQPLAVHYDYEKLGIWQLGEETDAAVYNALVGDIKVKDQDADGSVSAANDRVILGQQRPKWIASLGGSVQYKGFDLSFNFNSRWGYLVKPRPYDDITMDGQRWLPAVDYWTPDNPTNSYPRADQTRGYDTYRSSNGYQKGDHIKLQDVTIGYNFSHLLSGYIPIQNARLYFQMRNVAYLYRAADFDIIPEAPNFNFTVPASYNFGLNITF